MIDKGTVLVTGSSRGIGRAIALTLARDGYDVVVHCRSRIADAEAVAAEVVNLGRSARCLRFDVVDREECAARIAADIEAHGAYYGVVCNAGLAYDTAFPAMSGDAWDSVIR
ncbi:MAG: SDR family NAD(P)-dependent oxidoreductase, partial [Steroidobacteraceae bacterium]|nr:SDR family NAD(P)-dependent oxidoreductase [Steroidobacteraceae bacterium]